jgi:probable phosphoglycerate mutase
MQHPAPSGGAVYIVRHGETEWNLAHRWQGRSDSPLTGLGRRQAVAMGELMLELLGGERPHLVSSPLPRALTTARLIVDSLGLEVDPIPTHPLLVECNMGAWEGKTRADVDRESPGLNQRREDDKWSFRPEGGESHRDVAERAERWWGQLAPIAEPLVVVTHGITSRLLRGHYLGLDPQQTVALSHLHGEVFRLEGGVAQRFSVR